MENAKWVLAEESIEPVGPITREAYEMMIELFGQEAADECVAVFGFTED